MAYRLLADLVVLLHLLFVIFAVAGGLLCLSRRYWAWLHLPVAAWAAWVEWAGWLCPLTPLENRLRLLAGEQGYSGGFVEHYLLPVLYPADLTRPVQVGLGLLVIIVNLAIYVMVVRRWRRQSRSG